MSATPEPRRSALGSFALLLALVALLLAGMSWYRLRQAQDSAAALQQQLEDLKQNVALKDALAADAADTESSLKALGSRVDELDNSFSDLRKHSEEGRDAWIKAEAASLLMAANEQLQLRADPALALKALEQADARLHLLTDPRLIGVRQEIARETAALRALPQADLEGMTITLTAMAASVQTLPLKRGAPEHYQPGDEAGQAAPAGAGFWERLKLAALRVSATLFTVRRHSATVEPLLSPSEEFLLRRNLELKLESARSALLEREDGSFQAGAHAAQAWLQEYFDTDDNGVKGAVQQLAGMQKQSIAPKLPDISASLTLLRKLELPAGAAP